MARARVELPTPVVLVVVADPGARDRATFACRRAGAGCATGSVEWIENAEDVGACATVWDAVPFASAIPRLLAVRRRRARLPLVLYPPDVPGVGAILVEAGLLRYVTAIIQHGPPDVPAITSALARYLASRPEEVICSALRELLPNAPVRFHAAAQRMLRRRASAQRCAIKDVATDLQISADRLGMHWIKSGLPGAKELADWMTRLYAALVCEETGCTGAAAARAMGLTDRTRRRLGLASEVAAPDAFHMMFVTLAERCGLDEDEARQALDKAS